MKSTTTTWSPASAKVCSTVVVPFVTVAVWVCPSTVNSTVPAAPAGVTWAVSVVGSPAVAGPEVTLTPVASASIWTVSVSVLLV